jgi:hypothetical protein
MTTEFILASHKQKVQTIVKDIQSSIELAIMLTPTGQIRNNLTDINIQLALLEIDVNEATVKEDKS